MVYHHMAKVTTTLLQHVQQKIVERKLPPLLSRKFKILSDGDSETVRILQWNILAQALCQGADNFVLCPSPALDWQNRKLHILEELLAYDATILCLEEVDKFNFFKDKLKTAGYDGVFFPKPDSPCLYIPNSSGPDGCAIFWKTDQVNVIEQKNISLENSCGKQTNQVTIICKFKIKVSGQVLYVATTHLKAKDGFANLRYEQGMFLEKSLKETVGDSPLVLCGDFNADSVEKIYGVFKNSELGLVSSQTLATEDGFELPYTTWKVRGSRKGNREVKRTIDYVWFTHKNLILKSILSMPTEEEIGKDRLPSYTYPSDHLSLVCDFALKQQNL